MLAACRKLDVAGLAWVGAEAHRGVALDMLDRLETLAHRKQDVRRRHVVLQADELLGRTAHTGRVRHQPQRSHCAGVHRGDRRRRRIGRLQNGGNCLDPARRVVSLCAVLQGLAAATGACGTLVLRWFAGQESGQCVVPDRLAAGLAVQVDHQAVAARHRHPVAGHRGGGTGQSVLRVYRLHLHSAHMSAAARLGEVWRFPPQFQRWLDAAAAIQSQVLTLDCHRPDILRSITSICFLSVHSSSID